jgi:DNA-binding MarR family transcriptional regulator
MELELVELFPKQSDLRLQAVRLLMHLEESGPKRQTRLAEELGIEYAMSRLLAKLELYKYVARERDGTDKIVRTVRRPIGGPGRRARSQFGIEDSERRR